MDTVSRLVIAGGTIVWMWTAVWATMPEDARKVAQAVRTAARATATAAVRAARAAGTMGHRIRQWWKCCTLVGIVTMIREAVWDFEDSPNYDRKMLFITAVIVLLPAIIAAFQPC